MIQLINDHDDITVGLYKSEKQNLKRRRRSLAYLPESSSELTSSKRRDLPSKSVKSSIRRSNLRLERKPATVTLTFIMALTLVVVFSVASVATVWAGEVWTLRGMKMRRLLLFGQCIGFGSELSEGHIGREVVPWEPWMKGLCRKRRLWFVCCEYW